MQKGWTCTKNSRKVITELGWNVSAGISWGFLFRFLLVESARQEERTVPVDVDLGRPGETDLAKQTWWNWPGETDLVKLTWWNWPGETDQVKLTWRNWPGVAWDRPTGDCLTSQHIVAATMPGCQISRSLRICHSKCCTRSMPPRLALRQHRFAACSA